MQGQRSRSKVKVKGTLDSVASRLIPFLFRTNWTNHFLDMANSGYENKSLKVFAKFLAIEWVVLTSSWGQG